MNVKVLVHIYVPQKGGGLNNLAHSETLVASIDIPYLDSFGDACRKLINRHVNDDPNWKNINNKAIQWEVQAL